MNQSTRRTLIERVTNSADESSWDEFVNIYQRYVLGFMLKMGINFHEAEDLTQKVMVKLWKKLPEFEYRPGTCRFRSWLAIISRSLIRDHRNLKQNKLNSQMSDEEVPDVEITAEIETISLIEWKEFISKLAWERVSKRFNQLALDVFLQSSHKEIADIAEDFGLAENTVYVYRKRVETALKKEIHNLNYELG
ncbi:MAG: sigma-70 family RNA polymerase sigma factor [Lentisphaeraceae bacterium]|nr:sigma-70 family RNA polymerase sigma factor [Lentisphaeraceae bacterium]